MNNTGDEITGLTIFHELMHMNSIVSDHSYDKQTMVNLAKSDPVRTRLNSDSYLVYIA